MNCLQCGSEMRLKISNSISRVGDYECKKCNIGYHVMMYGLYDVKNNLVLSTHGGLRVARSV